MINTPDAKISSFKLRLLLLGLALISFWALRLPPPLSTEAVLVPAGATWKYLDNGSNQGTAWRSLTFDDSTWSAGPAQLGYGDGDEATVVGYGPSPNSKYVTTYFRHSFIVANASVYKGLTLRLLRDDGAVVYLNGAEVFRSNMPAGATTHTSLATSSTEGASESTFYTTNVDPSLLVNSTNVLAVEVHQRNVTNSDISFNLELIGSDTLAVIRGPYLQMGTATSVVVKWRTNGPSDSRVRYGTDPANLDAFADDAAVTTEHEITLSGLMSDNTYFYSVGATTATLAGGDASYFFITSPAVGTFKPTRIWVVGDSGTADVNATAVRDAYLSVAGSRPTDLWLMLGDNAYTDGTDNEYQAAVFNMYPTLLRQSVLWPTLGNHDGHTADSATQSGPYYSIFSLPKQGEAGGLASGTEAYYSFDYGNIHFICLESFETDRSANGPMMTWLQSDLAATLQQWVIAFWHHPPYSKGSHNSDTEMELIQMRENALPILESGGVDLVLSGHSHSYERSFLLDGHYGPSNTLTETMKKDAGDGRENGSGAYQKPTLGPVSNEGAVYAVAGSSGRISGGPLNHPAMFIALNSLGSLVLDIDNGQLDARFIDSTGVTRDNFTILKGTSGASPLAPSDLNATAASSSQIDLAWTDNANNESRFEIERSTDGSSFEQIATVGVNLTAYSNTGLAGLTTYYYRVRAHNSSGDSAYSNVASV